MNSDDTEGMGAAKWVVYALALMLIILLFAVSGCSSMGSFVKKATEPGKDERCFTGMGFEFCYFRERSVVQPADPDVQP